jgi:formimidoylglutamate deiminase
VHAAEQQKEVEECIRHLGARPVEWILQNLPVNDRFHIVHATHLNDDEVKRLAESRANVVLCPGTEGNLGDGIFRLTDYYRHGGSWSIGTDSHISLNPLEDMRWMDYAQRLITHRRNTFDDGASVLVNKTIEAGRKAMGLSALQYFEVGQPLDAVVYSAKSPLLGGHLSREHWLPSLVYTAGSGDILGTLVNAQWQVVNQHHKNEHFIRTPFLKAMREIFL